MRPTDWPLAVAADATIATDGWAADLTGRGGRPPARTINSKSEGKANHCLPAAHLGVTLFKRLLTGTDHGCVGRHLPAGLDEFVFRCNRQSIAPVRTFGPGIARAMTSKPVTNPMIPGAELSPACRSWKGILFISSDPWV